MSYQKSKKDNFFLKIFIFGEFRYILIKSDEYYSISLMFVLDVVTFLFKFALWVLKITFNSRVILGGLLVFY